MVVALEATAKGFANAVKRLAIQDKDFAMELAFLHNIRSEITPKALKQLTKDMFDKGGKLTESGRQELERVIQESGLSKNATWDEVLQKVVEKKRNFRAKLAEIKMPKVLEGKMKEISKNFKDFKLPNPKEFISKITPETFLADIRSSKLASKGGFDPSKILNSVKNK
ncbi:hypothetical protein J6P92_06830 [bacterium]|nr:hypothetical protein [bacterium]